MTDVAGMETLLKFRCMKIPVIRKLYQFERLILSPGDFDQSQAEEQFPEQTRSEARLIRHLRQRWGREYCHGDMAEYYANLFYLAMRESTIQDLGPIRRIHALLSAAMICYRLKKWNAFDAWPGKKPVFPTGRSGQ